MQGINYLYSSPTKHKQKLAVHIKNFLVSRRSHWRPKESRPYVRASVRACVRKYLRARLSNFSETWQLGRTWIGAENVPSRFFN